MCNAPVVPTSQTTTNHGTQSLKLLLGIGCGIPTVLILAVLSGFGIMCGVCSTMGTDRVPPSPTAADPKVVDPDDRRKPQCFSGFFHAQDRIRELQAHRLPEERIAPSCSMLLKGVASGSCGGWRPGDCAPVSKAVQRWTGSPIRWRVRVVAVSSVTRYVEFQCEDRAASNIYPDGIAFFEKLSDIKFGTVQAGQLMELQGVLVAGSKGYMDWGSDPFCLHLHGESIAELRTE